MVGDIHGCFDLLTQQLEGVSFDGEIDRLFSVGDLVDRGPESKDCLNWLAKPWFHAVRGNHEQMAIDHDLWLDDLLIKNGCKWFVDLTVEEKQIFIDAFDKLPYVIEVDTSKGLVGILHAEPIVHSWEPLKYLVDTSTNAKDITLWSRNRIERRIQSVVEGVAAVYVGHTPVQEVTKLGNVVYIDTGAVWTSKLTLIQI